MTHTEYRYLILSGANSIQWSNIRHKKKEYFSDANNYKFFKPELL